MQRLAQIIASTSIVLLISACASTPTQNTQSTHSNKKKASSPTSNACYLFKNNPNWYWEALNTYNHWGVPISVQMAIMQRESDFQAGARPPSKKLFGFVPWSNVTSAYGYAQALNGTWADYQQETKKYNTKRDKFGDASDFVGWYCNKANKQLGIPLNNAYALYLAYHEGLAGYANKTYEDKPWLINVAQSVQDRANAYRVQISQCKYLMAKAP
jgi:hypothetical protein